MHFKGCQMFTLSNNELSIDNKHITINGAIMISRIVIRRVSSNPLRIFQITNGANGSTNGFGRDILLQISSSLASTL